MFAFLKRSKYDARPVFETALAASRNPKLYRDLGVPDTFDGRFDCLLLHLWPLFRTMPDKLAQDVYDLTFKRMELALRETGTGDLGVGKQARRMMKAFYGRLSAYNACETRDQWKDALQRNLYGTVANANVPEGMIDYAIALGGTRVDLDGKDAKVMYPL
jgi:cytochrome b pre-mRNA-processing protein 3